MTTPLCERLSIGKSLLVQFIVFELLGVFVVSRAGGALISGIIAPLSGISLPFVAVRAGGPFPDGVLPIVLTAPALLGAGFVAWFYFRSRIAAHVAFALFNLFSIATFLLARPYQSSNQSMQLTPGRRTAQFSYD